MELFKRYWPEKSKIGLCLRVKAPQTPETRNVVVVVIVVVVDALLLKY